MSSVIRPPGPLAVGAETWYYMVIQNKSMRVTAKFNVNREKALFGEPDHPELCERIAAGIPEELLRYGRILDCSIGCGGIARAVVNRMVNELYIDHYDAILRVYGVDTNQALVNRARRLGFVNTVCADFLIWQPDMQFDVIVGNPPYQSPNTSGKKGVYKPLWPKFWSKAFALSTDDGYISFVGPASWCGPTSNLSKDWAVNGEIRLWDVFDKYSTVADVDSIHEFFPGVGSTFSVVAVDKSGREGLSFTNGFDASFGFYPKSGLEDVKANLATDGNIGTNFPGSPGNGKGAAWRVSIVSSRMVREETVEVLAEGETPASSLDPSLYTYVGCRTEEQAHYVRERVLECREILNRHCRYYGFICPPALRMITVPELPEG